ncbi:MAG: sugar phosphate isomerase/epimerase [Sphingomonadaceae bacterium]
MAALPDNPLLVASYFTLAGDINPFGGNTVSAIPFAQRAEAAATVGYRGIGIGHEDLAHLLETLGAAEIRRILAANSLGFLELEVLGGWFAAGEQRAASDEVRALLLRAAGELGAAHIKVAGELDGGNWPDDLIAREFAQLCDEAAAVGTAICIELYPASNIARLETGRAIVEGAGRRNGGLLLDIWHMMRGGIDLADVARLDVALIRHVELDDADAEQIGTINEDTVDRRRLCGEGDFPVAEFLNSIAATGYTGAYGVEILSEEHRRWDVQTAARRTFETTRRFFPSPRA